MKASWLSRSLQNDPRCQPTSTILSLRTFPKVWQLPMVGLVLRMAPFYLPVQTGSSEVLR